MRFFNWYSKKDKDKIVRAVVENDYDTIKKITGSSYFKNDQSLPFIENFKKMLESLMKTEDEEYFKSESIKLFSSEVINDVDFFRNLIYQHMRDNIKFTKILLNAELTDDLSSRIMKKHISKYIGVLIPDVYYDTEDVYKENQELPSGYKVEFNLRKEHFQMHLEAKNIGENIKFLYFENILNLFQNISLKFYFNEDYIKEFQQQFLNELKEDDIFSFIFDKEFFVKYLNKRFTSLNTHKLKIIIPSFYDSYSLYNLLKEKNFHPLVAYELFYNSNLIFDTKVILKLDDLEPFYYNDTEYDKIKELIYEINSTRSSNLKSDYIKEVYKTVLEDDYKESLLGNMNINVDITYIYKNISESDFDKSQIEYQDLTEKIHEVFSKKILN